MTIFEALATLNELINKNALPFILNSDSTLEEIKKAYKRLSKIYHPDNYMNDETKRLENEEIMKEINSAYETLEKRFNSSSHTERIDLEAMKKEYIKKMEHYNNVNTNEDTMKAHNEIAMQIVLYTASINNAKTEEEIKNNFDKFKNEIFVIYANLIESVFNKYLINKDEVTETISFGLSLDEFYNKLLEIKAKYSPLAKFDEVLEEFKLYKGYQNLEHLINNIVLEKEKLLKDKNSSLDNVINELRTEINALFKKYYEIKNIISNIKTKKKVLPADLNELSRIEQELEKTDSLNDILLKLENLLNKIVARQELKKQILEVNKIYANLILKVNTRLQALNPKKDNLEFVYINNCLLRVLNILSYARSNIILFKNVRRNYF